MYIVVVRTVLKNESWFSDKMAKKVTQLLEAEKLYHFAYKP